MSSTAALTRRGKPAKASAAAAAGPAKAGTVSADADVLAELPLWRRLLMRESRLKPEEVMNALHWIRQAYGVLVGLLYGAVGVTGAVGVMSYLFSCFVLTTGYFRVFLGVDDEEIAAAPGGGSLQTEGLFSSVALFVLTWTLTFSLIHAA